MRQSGRQSPALLALAFLAVVAILTGGARGQELDPRRTTAIKAGMVVNFIRYTTWPETAFTDGPSKAPIVVTVVGDLDMQLALASASTGQAFNGRRVEVRLARFPEPRGGDGYPAEPDLAAYYETLRTSHVVFFGATERYRLDEALRHLAGAPVLTVSDIPYFAERGGMLGLAVRSRRVAFDANEEAIRSAQLRVSSQVLRLANIVRPRGREGDGR